MLAKSFISSLIAKDEHQPLDFAEKFAQAMAKRYEKAEGGSHNDINKRIEHLRIHLKSRQRRQEEQRLLQEQLDAEAKAKHNYFLADKSIFSMAQEDTRNQASTVSSMTSGFALPPLPGLKKQESKTLPIRRPRYTTDHKGNLMIVSYRHADKAT